MPQQVVDVIENVSDEELVQGVMRQPFVIKLSKGEHTSTITNAGDLKWKGSHLQRAAHRWANKKGYATAKISGEEYLGTHRLICFTHAYVVAEQPTLAELATEHADSDVAAYRWARSKGYAAGWLNGEQLNEHRGVMCLKNLEIPGSKTNDPIFQVNDVELEDIAHSPDPRREDRVLRWAQDQGFVAGFLNNEKRDSVVGVVCIPRLA